MSSAGYHLEAFSEAAGIVLDPPFLAPPICFVFGAADILVAKSRCSGDVGVWVVD